MIKILLRIVAVLCGIWFGAVIGASVIVGRIRRRIETKAGSEYPPYISPDDRNRLDEICRRFKRTYKRRYKARTFRKIFGFKTKKRELEADEAYGMGKLLVDVAKVFNPDSERPLFELTGGEAFEFGHAVTEKLVGIFDASGLKFLNGVTVGTALDYIKIIDKAKKNKMVHGAKGAIDVIKTIVNVVNPFFWFKRTVSAIVTQKICDSVIFTGVETIVKEFASFYGKTDRECLTKEKNVGKLA